MTPLPGPELACPRCRGPLRASPDGPACDRCHRTDPQRADWIDFVGAREDASGGLGPALMHLPVFARVYERWWRPTFVRIAGGRERPSFEEEARWVMHALAPARGGAVVDLSCGPGLFARQMAASGLFERVYAVDHSEAMLHQCVEACARAGEAAPILLRADVSYLPFADGALAGVHAGAALHLWPRPNEGLSEVARVLRPGGVFVASTFVRPESGKLSLLADAFEMLSDARVFEEQALRNMCTAVGLDGFEATRRGAFILFSARGRS